MYYIMNDKKHVISSDKAFLDLCGMPSIEILYVHFVLDELEISMTDTELSLEINERKINKPISKKKLPSIFGDLTLVEIVEQTASKEIVTPKPQQPPKKETPPVNKDAVDLGLDEDMEPIVRKEEIVESDEVVDLNLDDEPIIETPKEEINTQSDDAVTLDVPLEKEEPKKEPIKETTLEESKSSSNDDDISLYDTTPIILNIEEKSEELGFPMDEYQSFLDEYIETAQNLESDLRGLDKSQQEEAIATLVHLGDMLEIPRLGKILQKVSTALLNEKEDYIDYFYKNLAYIIPEDKIVTKEEVEEVVDEGNEGGFGKVDLSNVKPIHFDFQLEEAANELSLPVELIEEFVNDFIAQAHEETVKMLKFHEEGNLDAIQKIGHLLKGASSNLRINPLADTLYEIQFCQDPKKLDGLIKDYWGHFLSFETQIKVISSK